SIAFRETGSVARKQATGRLKKQSNETVENVRQIIIGPSKIFFRNLSQVNFSYGTYRAILKKNQQIFPDRMTTVHELLPSDLPQRLLLLLFKQSRSIYPDTLILKIRDCGVQKTSTSSTKKIVFGKVL
ncbi:hypothetical protein BDFB_011978, partial [Asbolus verrucosus]